MAPTDNAMAKRAKRCPKRSPAQGMMTTAVKTWLMAFHQSKVQGQSWASASRTITVPKGTIGRVSSKQTTNKQIWSTEHRW